MIRDITLGQFFPGSSVLHRLDSRTKIIFTVIYVVALFTAKGYIAYLVLMLFLAVIIFISKVSLRVIMRSVRPIVILAFFTAMLNIFLTDGRILASFWIFKITQEGIAAAVYNVLRIVMLVIGTSIMTYTTSPMALTDGIESLMNPLKRIKVPVHELSMMMSTALRFVPTLIEETDKIVSAQKARGADFESGNLVRRAKAMLPILVPLFVSAFRRADDLAIAMESRCYTGGEGRTRMKQLKYNYIDFAAFAVGAALLAAIIILARFGN